MSAHVKAAVERVAGLDSAVAESLKRLCGRWRRTGTLPKSTVLARGRQTLSEAQVAAFGSGALRLSRDGCVRLRIDELLAPLDEVGRRQWVAAVHDALGLAFVEPGGDEKEGWDEAVQRWRLAFPELAAVEPLLEREGRTRTGAAALFQRWRRVGEIVRALAANEEPVTLSDLGARLCGDSKALRGGALINAVADWLYLVDNGEIDVLESSTGELRRRVRREMLARHGIVETGGSVLVTVYGPLRYRKAGRWFEQVGGMGALGEAAVLSLPNLRDVDMIEIPPGTPLVTCENESPFVGLVRKRSRAIVIYTQGFPNAAVCRLYRLLGGHPHCRERLHWGDSDPAGLRIAAILHGIRPLKLWRCDKDTLERHREYLKPLTAPSRERARKLVEHDSTFPFAEELRFALAHGWLEQEQWRDR